MDAKKTAAAAVSFAILARSSYLVVTRSTVFSIAVFTYSQDIIYPNKIIHIHYLTQLIFNKYPNTTTNNIAIK